MGKKELWRKFMRTGKVSDYLNYKNATEFADDLPVYDDEFTEEFSREFANEIDLDFPSSEVHDDDYENGWDSNT